MKHVGNVRAALEFRKQVVAPSRIVVSLIRQEALEKKLDAAVEFWIKKVGVDEVITRKFLTWDDNTTIEFDKFLELHLYKNFPKKKRALW